MPRNPVITASIMLALIHGTTVAARAQQALQLEATVPLGDVRGRIDHMAIDIPRGRLLVAELGNDSLGIVDVKQRSVVHRISGLSEPQGVGYVPSTDMVYVANGRDGSLRLFDGATYAEAARLKLGDDADNVRVDGEANHVIVGYGKGALAVLDAANRSKLADIRLKGHPESFQLGQGGSRAYVNVPNAHEITVVDLKGAGQIAASKSLYRMSWQAGQMKDGNGKCECEPIATG